MKTTQAKRGRTLAVLGIAALVLTACGGGTRAPADSPRVTLGGGIITEADADSTDSAAAAQAGYSGRSLYNGPGPRPGPALLYAAPPRAPQLENTGIWKARPIMVSGASAYRRGEFLYQDFLYDDRGAKFLPDLLNKRSKETFASSAGTYSYPDDPVYADNAADIVELRVKPASGYTAFRVTMNTLIDPQKLAIAIAIGDSATPRAFPFGANVKAPAQFFVTVHGNQAVMTNALTGAVVSPAPTVAVDLQRRQFEIDVPAAAWAPGRNVVRIAAGAGLWDAANGRYLLPAVLSSAARPGGSGLSLAPAAFFNVAFRYNEPAKGALIAALGDTTWREHAQSVALAFGDITPFFASVDFGKLADNVDDDMADQPQGVPTTGSLSRIFASQVETKQGVDFSVLCGGMPDTCKGEYRGQLQPYNLYVPAKAPPSSGYGLTLLLHSLDANHNQYALTNNQTQLGERGQGHLVATPLGRGPDGWYVDDAEADTFEMWSDIARNYPLNPVMSSVAGYSMGGYATFMFATRYPDLFAKAHASAAGPSRTQWLPPAPPPSGDATNAYNLLPSLRNVPILIWTQLLDEGLSPIPVNKTMNYLDDMGYRYRVDAFPVAEHLTLYLHDNYAESANYLGDAQVDLNPAHVTYVANTAMDVASRGIVGNHAYWLSNIAVRDASVVARGSVDAVSRAFGVADPVASATQSGDGVIIGSLGLQAFISQFKNWGLPAAAPTQDRLELVARNVSAVSVDMRRARLSCNAALAVDTDGPLTVRLEGCNRSLSY